MEIFSFDNIKDGETHSIDFKIKKETDTKSKEMLFDSIDNGTFIIPDYLLPSEMWATARNLSERYEKLNEVIDCRNEWHILQQVEAEEQMHAKSTITKLKKPFVQIETITYNKDNKPSLISKDTILLLHGTNYKFEEPAKIDCKGKSLGNLNIYFRYEWNETKWKNNIHTKYALSRGYEREIPEFINYMDWIYAFTQSKNIKISKLLPLYKNEKIEVLKNNNKIYFSKNGYLRLEARID